MTEQFTEADRRIVGDALRAVPTGRWAYNEIIDAVLSALAEAGRLLPDGAEVREQWGVRLVWDDPLREPDDFESENRRDAEHRYASHVEARRENPRWYVTPRLIRRTKITHVGSWVEADEDGTTTQEGAP